MKTVNLDSPEKRPDLPTIVLHERHPKMPPMVEHARCFIVNIRGNIISFWTPTVEGQMTWSSFVQNAEKYAHLIGEEVDIVIRERKRRMA